MERHIFASIDAEDLKNDYKSNIQAFYGFDPFANWDTLTSAQQERLKNLNLNEYSKTNPKSICRLGYFESNLIPKYARLVSCKCSTIGWKLRDADIKHEGNDNYLTTAYNLAIRARPGDKLTWWGASINPMEKNQVIIADVDRPGSSTEHPVEFTNYKRASRSFTNSAAMIDPTGSSLNQGIELATRSTYCITCTFSPGSSTTVVNYDIVLLILSCGYQNEEIGKFMAWPVVKVVVDPTIVVDRS